MTQRRTLDLDVVTVVGVAVMSLVGFLLVLDILGKAPWSGPAPRPIEASPVRPHDLTLWPMPWGAGEGLAGLETGRRTPGAAATMPAAAQDEPLAARQATRFVEHAFTLPSRTRREWVRAYTEPSQVDAVDGFLGTWLKRLNQGQDVDVSAGEPRVGIRTVGYQTLRSSGPQTERKITVILWQQISRQDGEVTDRRRRASARSGGAAPGSAYVLNVVSLTGRGADLVVTSMDGVSPGPAPAPGVDVIYPPLDR